MALPFWPFSKIAALVADVQAAEARVGQAGLVYASACRQRDEFRQKVAELETTVAQLAPKADLVSAIDHLASAFTVATLQAAENINASSKTTADRLAHSIGSVAMAQDKASNVQREWLEVSKGKR